ncbi:uncharacterized protein LOC124647801 [Lolium rigidum]|uniref:uncharacterized protein LOC124647801 n=1 Tax=Lolium rigidum TaxID=89674 RepID=UPI001F5DA1D7|nr:uncharacterized protein LOC124647801 [Lolium rigidum]
MAAAAVGGAVVPPMPPQQDEKAAQQPLMAVVAPLLPQPEGEQPPVAVVALTPPEPEEEEGEFQPLVAADAVVAPTPPRPEVEEQPPMAVDAVVAPLPPQPRADEEDEQPPEAADAVSEAISFLAPTPPPMPPPPQQQEAEDEQPAPAAAPPQPLESVGFLVDCFGVLSALGPGPVEEGYKETPQDENPLQVQGSADEGGKETPQDQNPLHVPGPADEGDKGSSSQDKNPLHVPGPADEGDKGASSEDKNLFKVPGPADEGDKGASSEDKNLFKVPGPADEGDNVTLQDENPWDNAMVSDVVGKDIAEIVLTHFMVADVVVIIWIVFMHIMVAEFVVIIETMLMHFMVPRVVKKKKIREIMMTHFMVADITMAIGIIEKMVTYLTVVNKEITEIMVMHFMDSLDDKRVYARTPCCFRNRIREKKDYPVGASLLNPEKWTCFLNCILQCVVHTVPLVSKLLKDRHLGLCPSGLDEFCCYCSLRHHASEAIRLSGNVLYPKKFVKLLKLICQDFSWGRHQDAHELLRCLLDKLDDASVAPMGVSSEEPCSIVKQVFGGQVKSQLHCPECNHCSDRLESFLDLSLEINQMDTLLDSLESFTKTEVVESFTCDGCKTRVNMEKHLKVEQAPEVLVIQLKRFENLGSNISKIQKMVKYQLELDLKPFMSSADTNPQKYDLYGVVEHLGESSKGHYVCYIRSSETDWYLFNDEKVMQLSEDKVLDSKAYLLFYVKQGSSPWFSTLLEEKNTLLLGYLQELADKGLNEDGVSIDSDKGSYSRSGSGSDSDEQDLSDAEMLYRRSLGGGLSGETKRPTSPPRSSLENGNVRRMALVSKNNENVSLQGSRGKEMSHSTHGLPSHVNGAGSRGGSSRENGESCSLLQSSSHKPEEDCCPENLTLHSNSSSCFIEDDEMRGSCVSPAGEVRAHYGVETRARKRMRQQSTAGTTAKRRKGGGLKKALLKKSVGGGGLKKALLKKSNLTEQTGDSILPYGYNTMDVKLSVEIGGQQRQSEKRIGGCLPLLFREDLLPISAGAMKIRAEPSGDRRWKICHELVW